MCQQGKKEAGIVWCTLSNSSCRCADVTFATVLHPGECKHRKLQQHCHGDEQEQQPHLQAHHHQRSARVCGTKHLLCEWRRIPGPGKPVSAALWTLLHSNLWGCGVHNPAQQCQPLQVEGHHVLCRRYCVLAFLVVKYALALASSKMSSPCSPSEAVRTTSFFGVLTCWDLGCVQVHGLERWRHKPPGEADDPQWDGSSQVYGPPGQPC